MNSKFFFILVFWTCFAFSQSDVPRAKIIKIEVVKDTIQLEKFSISPFNFKILEIVERLF
mgnify:CR=1 FL=1